MKKINIKLDPKKADVINIQKYLTGYEKATSIYCGNFTANWLLCDVHDPKWIIKTDKTIKKNGEYRYVKTISWDRLMPDGSLLCSSENVKVLHFFQKALFVMLDSHVICPTLGVASVALAFSGLLPLIYGIFRKELDMQPKTHVLSRLTHERLLSLVKINVHGGMFALMDVPGRFKAKFYEISRHKITSRNIYKLNKKDNAKVVSYFRRNNLYWVNKDGLAQVDRNRFFSVFGMERRLSYQKRFNAFLRQFERDYLSRNDKVLLNLKAVDEFPGHTTPLIEDVISERYDMTDDVGIIGSLLSMKKYFKEELPDVERIRFNEVLAYARSHAPPRSPTPLIPLNTCLKLINSAVDMVLNYGDKIVDAIEHVYDVMAEKNLLVVKKGSLHSVTRGKERPDFIKKVFEELEADLPCLTLKHGQLDYDRLRSEPSLCDLVYLLNGACLIIIAGMKPIRVNELSSLYYECLYHKENDGYWLMQKIQKAGTRGVLPEDAKPIPNIAAKAIMLLQRLNDHAKKYCPSKRESKRLFYQLHYDSGWKVASIKDSETIRNHLSFFCDYVESEVDNVGRRWYVNVHELRKSFLLNFFWMFKGASLDSARWMAGHTNSDHLHSYITSNLEGEEMAEIESEYAYQQLILFNDGNTLSDISNIEDLYEDVCCHFGVKSISDIEGDVLKAWLEVQVGGGNYEICIYGIDNALSLEKAEIAIKIAQV